MQLVSKNFAGKPAYFCFHSYFTVIRGGHLLIAGRSLSYQSVFCASCSPRGFPCRYCIVSQWTSRLRVGMIFIERATCEEIHVKHLKSCYRCVKKQKISPQPHRRCKWGMKEQKTSLRLHKSWKSERGGVSAIAKQKRSSVFLTKS